MRGNRYATWVVTVLLCASWLFVSVPFAGAASSPALVMREVGITGSELVVLQATLDIDNLSQYWLGYASSDTVGNLVPTQQLPAIKLKAGQAVLLTSEGGATCDAIYTDKLSFSMSNTAGTLELRKLSVVNSQTVSFTTADSVHWRNPSSSSPISSQDDINLDDEPTGVTNPVWYRDPADLAGAWQVGELDGCSLSIAATTVGGGGGSTTIIWPQASASPPATIISLAGTGGTVAPFIPVSDKGLLAPQLSEILPNPTSPKTDAKDEFIELYNPNQRAFDLSGFILESGSTTSSRHHRYTFPAGTQLPPNSFKAFYSSMTHLSLSNSGGQVWLLDPFENLVNKTEAYATAKDGQAWVLANGVWYWTLAPTPDKANLVNEPAGKAAKGKKTATVNGKPVTAVKGAAATAGGVTGSLAEATEPTPVHPWTLAAVAAIALLYGAYEYRHDLGNKLYQFRKHLAARRANRPKA